MLFVAFIAIAINQPSSSSPCFMSFKIYSPKDRDPNVKCQMGQTPTKIKMEQYDVNNSYHLFNFYCIPYTGIY